MKRFSRHGFAPAFCALLHVLALIAFTFPTALAAQSNVLAIQMGSYQEEASAQQSIDNLREVHRDILDDVQLTISRANIEGVLWYRVLGGPFKDLSVAAVLCEELRDRSASCFVIQTQFQPS